jgi:type I restriction enzyme M protein
MGSEPGTDIVQKLWSFCHTLRHDGIDYGDYIEQITYLLFLKMADERAIDLSAVEVRGARGKVEAIDCSWPTLAEQSGTDLTSHYIEVLRALGQARGMLGDIYSGAQSRFNNPVNLKRLVSLIDETEWTSLGVDIKAAAYEGLLEKAASEGKKGAGQFFTPRVLIQTIVRCMKPDPRSAPDFTICDPAVGTGGFLVAAYEWLASETKGALDREVAKRVKTKTYFGEELVPRPRRLALMNLYLHGIEPQIRLGDSIYEPPTTDRSDCILTNPPFGTKGANQAPVRDDFTISTSNKQLNFVQHILTILKPGGRAAVVLPDNVLFADQAGEVLKIVAEDCDLHTVLRLPRGTFTPYSQGVKANVLFFTKGSPTERVWIYDARTNVEQITKKDRPLTHAHFAEFETCYGSDPNGRSKREATTSKKGRWRVFSISEVREKEFKLDAFKWLKEEHLDDADDLPPPEELAIDAIAELEESVAELNQVLAILEGDAIEATAAAATSA